MKYTELRVRGKINLFLRVGKPRQDGYHNIESLMLHLPQGSPEDILRLTPGTAPGLQFVCSAFLPDTPNTVRTAYEQWSLATGHTPALAAELVKGIPHGAGLGGGSADAAALLLHLQTLISHPLSAHDLGVVAAKVGADVPFFLQSFPALVHGMGEKITPCPSPVAGFYGLLLCPPERVNTGWAYSALDFARLSCPKNDFLTRSAKPGKKLVSRAGCQFLLENSFEPVVFAAHARLACLKEVLLRLGAALALMSGSGSSLFGMFRSKAAAARAAEEFVSSPHASCCALFGPLEF